MPVRHARKARFVIPSRAAARLTLAAAVVVLGCESLQNAIAEGDTRTISLHQLHTGEKLAIMYKRNGRYDDDALKKINWFLRDWRRNEETRMDPRLIDLVWEVQRDVGSKEAIQVVCGYRAPGTNEMLRKRSRNSGVARFSQHTLGKAMDFYIPDAPLDELRAAGLRLQRGGVGFYPTSGSPFVHLDVGSVRHWPRMTREQLVRVFPNGRTVHIPTDGQPLQGYQLALADIEKRGGEVSSTSMQASRNTGEKRSLLAKLFGFGKDKDEDDSVELAASQVAQVAPLRPKPVAVEPQKPDPLQAAVPLPKGKPAPVQIADARPVPARTPEPKIVPVPRAAQTASLYATASAPAVPVKPDNSVFEARGFWRGVVEPSLEADRADPPRPPAEIASADASANPTGSIGAWPSPTADDRSPADTALAYAAPNAPKVVRQAPMGAALPRAAAVAGVSVAVKGSSREPAEVRTEPVPARVAGERLDNPWLRAMVMAPNLHSYMTATLLGAIDMRALTPLMQRPTQALAMTFSEDPNAGMSTQRFTGSAVVFMATATFASRTAALQ